MTRADAYKTLQENTYISISQLMELENCSRSLANTHAKKIRMYVKQKGKTLPKGQVPVSLYLKLIANTTIDELHKAFLYSREAGLIDTTHQ